MSGETLESLIQKAENGDANAQLDLALRYDEGKGVVENKAEAVKWYQLAANQGNLLAQCNLGVMFDEGEGVAQDKKEAVKWYQLAAAQGHARAQSILKSMLAASISMVVLEGFIAVAGIAAVAVAFAVLNAATFGIAGLIVAGVGAAATLCGVGLFAADLYRNRQNEINPIHEPRHSLAEFS